MVVTRGRLHHVEALRLLLVTSEPLMLRRELMALLMLLAVMIELLGMLLIVLHCSESVERLSQVSQVVGKLR